MLTGAQHWPSQKKNIIQLPSLDRRKSLAILIFKTNATVQFSTKSTEVIKLTLNDNRKSLLTQEEKL